MREPREPRRSCPAAKWRICALPEANGPNLLMSIVRAILSEMAERRLPPRVPEVDLVMNDEPAVAAFERAGAADGSMAGVYAYHLRHLASIIRENDAVLDLGCGPGRVITTMAGLSPDVRFVGVELSAGMLKAAEAACRQAKLSNVSYLKADMTLLEQVPAHSIDVVTSLMALHHVRDIESLSRLFCNVERVLRPGGGVFMLDLGRLRSSTAVDYFVRRSIPPNETYLERDYRASLQAAFSREEIAGALPEYLRRQLRIHSTPISPFMIALKGGRASIRSHPAIDSVRRATRQLSRRHRRDVRQLEFFFSLGGLR